MFSLHQRDGSLRHAFTPCLSSGTGSDPSVFVRDSLADSLDAALLESGDSEDVVIAACSAIWSLSSQGVCFLFPPLLFDAVLIILKVGRTIAKVSGPLPFPPAIFVLVQLGCRQSWERERSSHPWMGSSRDTNPVPQSWSKRVVPWEIFVFWVFPSPSLPLLLYSVSPWSWSTVGLFL